MCCEKIAKMNLGYECSVVEIWNSKANLAVSNEGEQCLLYFAI